VQYEEFISSVRERGVPGEEAETLTHATLRVLAERLTGGEADDIRAQQRAMTLAAEDRSEPTAMTRSRSSGRRGERRRHPGRGRLSHSTP
jgi:uncharacterized protein (DUF2267 family)